MVLIAVCAPFLVFIILQVKDARSLSWAACQGSSNCKIFINKEKEGMKSNVSLGTDYIFC